MKLSFKPGWIPTARHGASRSLCADAGGGFTGECDPGGPSTVGTRPALPETPRGYPDRPGRGGLQSKIDVDGGIEKSSESVTLRHKYGAAMTREGLKWHRQWHRFSRFEWWARDDSNIRPLLYQSSALTN